MVSPRRATPNPGASYGHGLWLGLLPYVSGVAILTLVAASMMWIALVRMARTSHRGARLMAVGLCVLAAEVLALPVLGAVVNGDLSMLTHNVLTFVGAPLLGTAGLVLRAERPA